MPQAPTIESLCADVSGRIAQFLTPKEQLSFYHACSGSVGDSEAFEQIARGIASQLLYHMAIFPVSLLARGYVDPKHVDRTTLVDVVTRKSGSNRVFRFTNYLALDLVERERVFEKHEKSLVDGLISDLISDLGLYRKKLLNFCEIFVALRAQLTASQKTQLVKIIVSTTDYSFTLSDLLICLLPSLDLAERRKAIHHCKEHLHADISSRFLLTLQTDERQDFLSDLALRLERTGKYEIINKISWLLNKHERRLFVGKLCEIAKKILCDSDSIYRVEVFKSLALFASDLTDFERGQIINALMLREIVLPGLSLGINNIRATILRLLLPHVNDYHKELIWVSFTNGLRLSPSYTRYSLREIGLWLPYASAEQQSMLFLHIVKHYGDHVSTFSFLSLHFPSLFERKKSDLIKAAQRDLASLLKQNSGKDLTDDFSLYKIGSLLESLSFLVRCSNYYQIYSGMENFSLLVNSEIYLQSVQIHETITFLLAFSNHIFDWSLLHKFNLTIREMLVHLNDKMRCVVHSEMIRSEVSGWRRIFLYAYCYPDRIMPFLKLVMKSENVDLANPSQLSQDAYKDILSALIKIIHLLVPKQVTEDTARSFLIFYSRADQPESYRKDAAKALELISELQRQSQAKMNDEYFLSNQKHFLSHYYPPFDKVLLPELCSSDDSETLRTSLDAQSDMSLFLEHALLTRNENSQSALRLVATHYTYAAFGLNSRYHFFKAKAASHQEKGDALKTRILIQFTETLLEAAERGEEALLQAKAAIVNDPAYQILAKGQGCFTRLFHRKTSSVMALDHIFRSIKPIAPKPGPGGACKSAALSPMRAG